MARCILAVLTSMGALSATSGTARADSATPEPPEALLHVGYRVAAQLIVPSLGGRAQTPNGAVDADVSLRNGAIAGTLDIPELAGQALVYGFAPSVFVGSLTQVALFTGGIALQPGKTSGDLSADYEANFTVKVSVFGVFPVNGGAKCKSASPIDMSFTTDSGSPFDAFRGGRVTAWFAVPTFGGCGRFDALLNAMVVRPDKTVELRLDFAPKK